MVERNFDHQMAEALLAYVVLDTAVSMMVRYYSLNGTVIVGSLTRRCIVACFMFFAIGTKMWLHSDLVLDYKEYVPLVIIGVTCSWANLEHAGYMARRKLCQSCPLGGHSAALVLDAQRQWRKAGVPNWQPQLI